MAAALSRFHQFTRQPPAQLWAEASRLLPPWVVLVLVLLIGWQLARLAWLLVPAPAPEGLPPIAATAPATTADPARSVSIDRIVAASLFGTAEADAPVALVEQEDAPDTDLRLELRGTVAATDETRALAIIAEVGGAERVYFIGDAVPGGASLHAVHFDRVLLRRGGRLEALRLPRSDAQPVQRTAAAPRAAPRATPPVRAATIQEVVRDAGVSLTEIIRPQPVFKDGRQQGYRVYPGRQRQQFAQLGLRPGDLVTQINGMALDDPARGMEIFRGLADATSVTVTVDRNGEIELLTLDTNVLRELQDDDAGTPTQ
ncbi:MAG: type II secretion system protein GspC [Gammaproteobacteria bacterium]